jgi:hypothetical protein
MAYDLVTAKKRLGITDDSQDAAITACLAMAQSLAETFCDRGFTLMAETQEMRGLYQNTLRTYRYPIKEVTGVFSLTPGSDLYEWPIDTLTVFKKSGEIVLQGSISGVQIQVDYEGGYETFPTDLEFALWGIFDAVWYSTPGMGVIPGEATSSDPGTIKSFWINGVRLEYVTGSSGSAASSASKEELYGILPLTSVAVLSAYKAESALSGG